VNALSSIARFVELDRTTGQQPRCELCGGPVGVEHRHVLELGQPGVHCACHACAILFGRGDQASRFRTIPDRVIRGGDFGLTPEQWAGLGIPVALAICYRDSRRGTGIVCYPGPAGIVEAELEDATWDAIAAATPLASQLEPDVEALLVRTGRGATSVACYLIPISTAYELVGRLRTVWEGFSGGERAEHELAAFFADLDRKGRAA
jgi:hypothetical protein